MAKAATIKVKLVSSADTGFYYVTREEFAHHDRQAGEEEIRSGGEKARRVPRIQDQVRRVTRMPLVDARPIVPGISRFKSYEGATSLRRQGGRPGAVS